MGEVSALAPVQLGGFVSVFAPSASTVLVTGHLSGTQSILALPTTDDATISPTGAAAGVNGGLLTVATSTTADHSTTFVSLLKFAIPASATPAALTSAILELSVATPPSQKTILTVFGAACGTQWSESTVSWSSAQSFAVSGTPNAAITALSQNFMYMDNTTTQVVGHITVLPTTAAGTILRIDIADYAATCAGSTATLTIARRFRNPQYVGQAVGPIAADTLSGGASVQFDSGETTTGTAPVLRLLSSSALATGVMSLSVPASAAATPAGRHLLAGGTTARTPTQVASVLSSLLSVPVVVDVTAYSIFFEVTIQNMPYSTFASIPNQAQLLAALSSDLSEPTPQDVRRRRGLLCRAALSPILRATMMSLPFLPDVTRALPTRPPRTPDLHQGRCCSRRHRHEAVHPR